MICVAIKGPSFQEAAQQIENALDHASLIELRLDLFHEWNEEKLQDLRATYAIPMIFTLRSKIQGGEYVGTEELRQKDLMRLAQLEPEYLDLESHLPVHFVKEIAARHPDIKCIVSYHDFSHTPSDIESIYHQLTKMPASLYKIALQANNSIDAMRLLCWSKGKNNLIAISMGPFGQISRILGPVVGSHFTYACPAEELQTAPGQLGAHILANRYGYHRLKKSTSIYGLIGDPVSLSISHVTHNLLIQKLGLNAVYVKIPLRTDEVFEFLRLAKQLPI